MIYSKLTLKFYLVMYLLIMFLFMQTIYCTELSLEEKSEILRSFLCDKDPNFCSFIYINKQTVRENMENFYTRQEVINYLQKVLQRYNLNENHNLFNLLIYCEDPQFVKFCNNSQDFIKLKLSQNCNVYDLIEILKKKYAVIKSSNQ